MACPYWLFLAPLLGSLSLTAVSQLSSSLCIGFLAFVWHFLTSLVSVPCLEVNMHDQASKVITLYNSHLPLIAVVDLWNIRESNHVPSPHLSDQEHTCANSFSLDLRFVPLKVFLHLELSSDQENKNDFADEHERLWFLGHKVESTMEYFEENLLEFCKLTSAAPPEYQELSRV